VRLRREDRTLEKLWSALDQEIGSGCVAIIGITGRTDHRCAVYRVTPKTLRLLDSSGRSCIHRSRCTVRTVWSFGQTCRLKGTKDCVFHPAISVPENPSHPPHVAIGLERN
jgi:hypothetical protein